MKPHSPECVERKLSNTIMQELFEKLGYIRSGYIENLDEGDPEIIYFKRSIHRCS
jgi:hypothetical protein